MKRILLALIFMAVALQLGFSEYYNSTSALMEVNGYVDQELIVILNDLDVATEGGVEVGMPFDLEGDDVKYSSAFGMGRKIGEWSLYSNGGGKFDLSVSCTKLVNEGNSSSTLDYCLDFRYNLMHLSADASDNTSRNMIQGDFRVSSTDGFTNTTIASADMDQINSGDYIGSYSQSIRFCLADGQDVTDATKYSSGWYRATVTMTVTTR